MKTICPYCKQEYLDAPDEYLGMTLECSVCKKEFVCEKAKFCSECGAISPAQAEKCEKCGHFFPKRPTLTPVNNQSPRNWSYDAQEEESEEAECEEALPWYKRLIFRRGEEYESNAWGVAAIALSLLTCFVPVLILPAIIYALVVHASRSQRYIALAIVVMRMIVNVVVEMNRLG